MEQRVLVTLVFGALVTVARAQQCPNGCECYNEFVMCDGATSVPTGFTEQPKTLSLPNHSFLQITRANFTSYAPIIEKLSINNGTLADIADGTFADMRNLVSLDLSNTSLMFIKTNTFQGLENLEDLDLSGSELRILEREPFGYLLSLKTLDLRRCNRLVTIRDDAFHNLEGLDELLLGSSVLESFPTKSFEPLINVTHLMLEDMPYESLDSSSFPTLPKLRELCIDGWSNLKEVGYLAPNLTELSISNGRLDRVPVAALNSATLEKLTLDNNPTIQSLRLHDFAGIINLRELSLSNIGLQKIHEAPFHDNLHLVSLDLSHNHIEVLPVHTLFRLFELKKLRISHNNITTLLPSAFENTRQINEIDVAGNPMICDCNLRWLRNWHSVNIINHIVRGTCDQPRTHKGTPISSIDSKFFICEAPTFTVHNTTVSLPLNKSTTVDCVPHGGSPDPTISWSDSQGRNIPNEKEAEKLGMKVDMWQLPNGSLHVEHMRPRLRGIYRCTATNKEGSSIKTYNFLYKYSYDPVEVPEAKAISATSITMIVIGLLLLVGGAIWYMRKRSEYKTILENGEGVKWNAA